MTAARLSKTKPTFFASSSAFRAWLQRHHADEPELWVGFYKKKSGRPSMTWAESVDQALCFGWIDGIRKRLDDQSYVIRFTPRRPGSIWSAVNIRRVAALTNEGLMRPAGKKAFAARIENKSGIYSYEQRPLDLPLPYANGLRANIGAWEFFQKQPPSYRKMMAWWIVSAKQEQTRSKRMQKLIAASAKGVRL